MTQSNNDTPAAQPPPLATRLAWGVLILTTLYLCYFHNLGAIGLVGPDEPRYAWIARDIAESGDWITPHLYGKPWFEKPPLYYWSAALSFKLFGVSETTARLPSAIYALLATLAAAWLASRIYGEETACWLLLLLPTSVAMIGFSHAAATDTPFAGTLTVAMLFAARLLGLCESQSSGGHDFSRAEKPANIEASAPEVSESSVIPVHSSTFLNAILFGFFLGLAVLAKGPAAIILSGGAVLLWAFFTTRWRDAFRCLHPLSIAAFCLTALPWYILCALRNPDFFRIFIVEHNFRRFLTPEFQHIQPFWYYAGILLIAFLPWTLVPLYSAIRGWADLRRTHTISSGSLFLLCWAIFVVVFFSISKSKLPGYILPAIPAIALLVVRGYVRAMNRQEKLLRWLLIAAASLTLFAAFLISLLHFGDQLFTQQATRAVALALALFALANSLLGLPPTRPRSIVPASALSVIPILLLLCLYPRLQSVLLPHDPSGKTLAADLAAHGISPENLFVGPMKRGQQYSLSFYLHREITVWGAELKNGYLLLNSRSCERLVTAPWTCEPDPLYLQRSGYFLYTVSAPR